MRSALAAGSLAAGLVAGTTVAPAYAVDNVCGGVDATTPPGDTGRASQPFELLGMDAAQQEARRAPSTAPVRVAVLGPGVRAVDGNIPVHASIDKSGAGGEVADPLGTTVAGLVAGASSNEQQVGFSRTAEVVDVRVFVSSQSGEAGERPDATRLAAGLQEVARQAGPMRIKVAVVPFVVGDSVPLRTAVRRVRDAGVVVVAASGDRPDDASEFAGEFEDPPAKDEDAGPLFFPAGYDGVVAVNATGAGDPAGALDNVVKNSRTTVAAPTYDAVSYGLNGSTCLVEPTSTSAAAGEVAGVVALLWQRFPDDRPAQIVSRLVNTADGTTDDPTPLTGAGVVQPYEAMTRPLAPSRTGRVERTVVRDDTDTSVTAPEPAPDLLETTREHAVWWGLIGGGLLVVALLLRPVLGRRRAG